MVSKKENFSIQTDSFVLRPRITGILDKATQCKLVYVIAGAGCGKTQAVGQYISRQDDAVVRWIHLTESDNSGARYWEHLTKLVERDNEELAERLREFGFPDTSVRFNQFAEILKTSEHRSHKTFLVLDDFHLIHSEQALTFAERCAHLQIPGACVIILSRSEPQINAVSLFAKGQAAIVTEDELNFTEDEITRFLQKRDISLPVQSIAKISDVTKGWALAISLLSLTLKKSVTNIDIMLDVLKQNIFKLMETEAWEDFPDTVRKALAKLSLISELPPGMLWNRFSGIQFLRQSPQLIPFVWYDSITGQDRVHPLYWDFLASKQDILTEEEKQDTYRQAAAWCEESGFYLDAVKYLALSYQYEAVLRIFLSYPHKLPHDSCLYYLDVLRNCAPADTEETDINYLLLDALFIPLLLTGACRYNEAEKHCFATINRWGQQDKVTAYLMLSIAYSNLAYIDMFTCTVSHRYNAPQYMKESVACAEKYTKLALKQPAVSTGIFAVADMRSFATLVGEGAALKEFDIFLEKTRQTAGFISETVHNMYYGYDDMAACEIAFYKNNIEEAKRFAHSAILKARERNQHSIEAMAAMYLFRIAVFEGDYPIIKELFRERNDGSGVSGFWNRKFLYELGVGFLYAQIGVPKMVPVWLASDSNEATTEAFVPVRELICGAKYYLASGKSERALTYLCNYYPRLPHERFLFGELTLTLLTAVSRVKTGDIKGAAEDFAKAYKLSFDGVFEMPFIELGRDLRLLVNASKQFDCGFEESRFNKIVQKATVYSKKLSVILDCFKRDEHIKDAVSLSAREREILNDLFHGLSREEIATVRYLSINTVHKVIQSIFLKLDAYGKADAIRIALERGLLEQ